MYLNLFYWNKMSMSSLIWFSFYQGSRVLAITQSDQLSKLNPTILFVWEHGVWGTENYIWLGTCINHARTVSSIKQSTHKYESSLTKTLLKNHYNGSLNCSNMFRKYPLHTMIRIHTELKAVSFNEKVDTLYHLSLL